MYCSPSANTSKCSLYHPKVSSTHLNAPRWALSRLRISQLRMLVVGEYFVYSNFPWKSGSERDNKLYCQCWQEMNVWFKFRGKWKQKDRLITLFAKLKASNQLFKKPKTREIFHCTNVQFCCCSSRQVVMSFSTSPHPCLHGDILSQPIGASLSEPHTSVTSLHPCVCMFACLLGPTTYHKSLPALILHGLRHTLNSKTTR